MVRSTSGTEVTLDWATPNESNALGRVIFARKTASETASGTTLQNDDHLSLALDASRAYEVSGALFVDRPTGNANFDLAWSVPGGTGTAASNSTMLISYYAFERKNSGNRDVGGDTRTSSGSGAPDAAGEITLGNSTVVVHFKGIVLTGTTSGDITVQWAPTSGPNDEVEVLTNSYMRVSVAD